jgi:hypothetical protein
MRIHLLLLLLVTFPVLASAATVDAPYHVTGRSGQTVTVDLGKQGKPAKTVVLIGKDAAVKATLKTTKRVCEELCGKEVAEPECHREAVYTIKGTAPKDATFVLAIAGTHKVKTLSDDVTFNQSTIKGSEFVSDTFQNDLRWHSNGLFSPTYLEMYDVGKDWYAPPIKLSDCAVTEYRNFRKLACGNANLLYNGTELITYTTADYSDGALDIAFAVEIDGALHYVVQQSIKGRSGLYGIMDMQDGKWNFRMTTPDYASLC